MPEFHLDTSGEVSLASVQNADCLTKRRFGSSLRFEWADLDAFTQGYIEALFFTNAEELGAGDFLVARCEAAGEAHGFSDLAPETLAQIIANCAKFQASDGWRDCLQDARREPERGEGVEVVFPDDTRAGRDFWYTRNGHGAGFWDGDWPEPYGAQLAYASTAFGEVDAYLGDDGKVHLS